MGHKTKSNDYGSRTNGTRPIVVRRKSSTSFYGEIFRFWPAEEYHQQYLEKGGQKADKGYLEPIKCYG